MLKTIITTITCAWIGVSCAHEIDSLENTNKRIAPTVNLVESRFLNDTVNLHYVSNIQLFEQEWDRLAHPVFWKTIMTLSPDSCVINIGATREIVEVTSLEQWDLRTDEEKDAYRDSIRVSRGLDSEAKVYMTTGKKDFYAFDHVLSTISRGVERSEEHTSELQSRPHLVCRLLLEKKKKQSRTSGPGGSPWGGGRAARDAATACGRPGRRQRRLRGSLLRRVWPCGVLRRGLWHAPR